MNMKKRSWILIITSVLFLAFLCVGTLVTPEVGFSENENRYLQAAPKLTVDHVLNGRFETQAEDYLNDQIIGRSLWVRTMAMTEAALGVGDINGVYLAADGRVVKRVTEADFDWDRFFRGSPIQTEQYGFRGPWTAPPPFDYLVRNHRRWCPGSCPE